MQVKERFIRQAIELARQARAKGNHPFGSLLVIGDAVVLTAENTVSSESNPTGHAETNLVQKAIRQLSEAERSNATLYTSTEPCAMCAGAIYWAGIRRVVYALASDELAKQAGERLRMSCREVFASAVDEVEVAGPFLTDEALPVHQGFWK
ncbi:MAG: nucleoside deaminase [Acidobacteriota bacterium]